MSPLAQGLVVALGGTGLFALYLLVEVITRGRRIRALKRQLDARRVEVHFPTEMPEALAHFGAHVNAALREFDRRRGLS